MSKIVLDPRGDEPAFRMSFGQSRAPDARRIVLDAWQGEVTTLRGLEVRLGGSGYVAGSGDRTISLNDEDGLYARLRAIDARALEVCVEVRPREITQFRPGRWSGMVVVAGETSRATLAAIPVELTFRAPLPNAIVFAFLGVVLGLTVNVLGEAAAGQRANRTPPLVALRSYVTQLTFPATVIVAGVAGWLVFSQTYASDPVWGADNGDATKLLGACFIAQLGSVEGVNLAKRIGGGGSDDERRE